MSMFELNVTFLCRAIGVTAKPLWSDDRSVP